jgi:hypothetical protein
MNNNNNNNNNNEEGDMYGLKLEDYDRDSGEYFYNVEYVPDEPEGPLLFKKGASVVVDSKLKKIGKEYLIEGKKCRVVEFTTEEVEYAYTDEDGITHTTVRNERLVWVVPVGTTGGKRKNKKTRKQSSRSGKSKKKSKGTRRH